MIGRYLRKTEKGFDGSIRKWRQACLKGGEGEDKPRGFLEIVIIDNKATARFAVLVLFLAGVACGLGWFFVKTLEIGTAEEIKFSSFAITYTGNRRTNTFTIIHANQMLPEDGIEIMEEVPVTVRATGLVCTGPESELKSIGWNGGDYDLMKNLMAEKYRFTTLPCNSEELKNYPDRHLYYMALGALRREHSTDVNLQWRRPDGKYVCGIDTESENQAPEDDSAGKRHVKSNEAKVLPKAEWGHLLGTIATDRSGAYSNLKAQVAINQEKVAQENKQWVFRVGEGCSFYIDGNTVYKDKSGKDPIGRFKPNGIGTPKLFLFVNDVFLTKDLLKDLSGCDNSVYSREYEYQISLFKAAKQNPDGIKMPEEWQIALSGLWYLNNLGLITVTVDQKNRGLFR